uniref:Uncharacterized protein n=1 Tax=viral metagenome TaxID=1070528 RepID=A0A6C0KZ47_9ZZZZ
MQAQRAVQQAVFNEGLWLRALEDAKLIEGIPPQFGAERARRAWDMMGKMGEVTSPSFKALPHKEQVARKLMAQYLMNIALESENNSEDQLLQLQKISGELLIELGINVSTKESAVGKIKQALERHLELGLGSRISEHRTATWARREAENTDRKAKAEVAAAQKKVADAQFKLGQAYAKEADNRGMRGDRIGHEGARRVAIDIAVYDTTMDFHNQQSAILRGLPASAQACWNNNPALHALFIGKPVAAWAKYMSGGTRKGRRSKKLKTLRRKRV